MVVNNEAKRIWFLSDTHLGVKNNSNDWIDITSSYFYEWFIPLVKKNYEQGDILIHLGDVFDSRQSINLKVLKLGVDIFESLSEIFCDGIYVIAGNHDLWGNTTNEINSLKSIKWIPNVNIFEEPDTLILGKTEIFMMPWRKNHEEDTKTLEETQAHDVLCCHADIRGLKFNKYVMNEDGSDISKFEKFKKVYSGHIHYAQVVGNINMLGSPYEITRSDMDNPKSVWLLDLETLDDKRFINNHSPKYKRFNFDEILESTPEQLEPEFKNNFVDILIDPVMSLKAPLSILTDIITTQKSLKFHPYDPNQATSLSRQIIDTDGKQFNVLDFAKEFVNNLDELQETKDKMYNSLVKLHNIVLSQSNESIK
jgi:DNA repair exonuclease SbcCD nuclease subunit